MKGLKVGTGAVYLVMAGVIAKFVLYDLPAIFGWSWFKFTIGKRDQYLAWDRMATFGMVLTGLYLFAKVARQAKLRLLTARAHFYDSRVIFTVWVCLLFILLNIEVSSFFHFQLPAACLVAVSVLWAVFSVVLMGMGLAMNILGMRKTAMILLFVTAGKVLLLDTGDFSTPYRINGPIAGYSCIEFRDSPPGLQKELILEGSGDQLRRTPITRDTNYDFTSQVELRKVRLSFSKTRFQYFRIKMRDAAKPKNPEQTIQVRVKGADVNINYPDAKQILIERIDAHTGDYREALIVYDKQTVKPLKPIAEKNRRTIIEIHTGIRFERIDFEILNPHYYRQVHMLVAGLWDFGYTNFSVRFHPKTPNVAWKTVTPIMELFWDVSTR